MRREFKYVSETSCGLHEPVDFGRILYPDKRNMYGVGATALLSCFKQYHASGNILAKCDSDGVWRPRLGFFLLIDLPGMLTYAHFFLFFINDLNDLMQNNEKTFVLFGDPELKI